MWMYIGGENQRIKMVDMYMVEKKTKRKTQIGRKKKKKRRKQISLSFISIEINSRPSTLFQEKEEAKGEII